MKQEQQPQQTPHSTDPNDQIMGNVLGGVKDSYFVTKLLSWYWKRFKKFCFG
jgi:hypothetical protein